MAAPITLPRPAPAKKTLPTFQFAGTPGRAQQQAAGGTGVPTSARAARPIAELAQSFQPAPPLQRTTTGGAATAISTETAGGLGLGLGTEEVKTPATPTPSGGGQPETKTPTGRAFIMFKTTAETGTSTPTLAPPELPDLEMVTQSTRSINDLATQLAESKAALAQLQASAREAEAKGVTASQAAQELRTSESKLQEQIIELKQELDNARKFAKIAWPTSFANLSRKHPAAVSFYKNVLYVIQDNLDAAEGNISLTGQSADTVRQLQETYWNLLFKTGSSVVVHFDDLDHINTITELVWETCRTVAVSAQQQDIMAQADTWRTSLGLPSMLSERKGSEEGDTYPSGEFEKKETLAQAERILNLYSEVYARLFVLREDNFLGALVNNLVKQASNESGDRRVVSLVDTFAGVDRNEIWKRAVPVPSLSGVVVDR